LWRNVERDCTEIDLLVRVDAGDDEEDTGPLGASLQQTTEPEYDGSLVLLYHLGGGNGGLEPRGKGG